MGVDNGFIVWRYNGQKLYNFDFKELYQFSIRPAVSGLYPDCPPSPDVKPIKPGQVAAVRPKAYVPPHLRKRQQRSATNARSSIGGRNHDALSASELKRREEEKERKKERKRQKKKAKQAERRRQEELKKQEEEQKKAKPKPATQRG